MRFLCGVGMILAMLNTGAGAQAVPTPAATGTVTGHVVCADTQLPARFAQVSLVHKPTPAELAALADPDPPDIFGLLQERTALDGSYTIGNVPPGDYWVVAERDGYLYPLGSRTDETLPPNPETILAGAPVVHVAVDGTAKADVTLQPGATVEGQVLFGDGSPAVDWEVWLLPTGAGGIARVDSPYVGDESAGRKPGPTTDDRGRFRIAGVPPGKYLVVTQLTLGTARDFTALSTGNRVLAFAPGVFSRGEARPVEVRGTEDTAIDLKLDLSRLHSIRGRVLAKVDLQPGAFGIVTVAGAAFESVKVAQDGSFHLDYLPAGTYTVSVIPGFPDPKDRTRHFERPKQTVVLGDSDVTLEDILLEERPKVAAP